MLQESQETNRRNPCGVLAIAFFFVGGDHFTPDEVAREKTSFVSVGQKNNELSGVCESVSMSVCVTVSLSVSLCEINLCIVIDFCQTRLKHTSL